MKKPNPVVVARVESRLYKHIIDNSVACHEGCRCNTCFHKFLDSVVSASDLVTPALDVQPIEIERFVD